MQESKTADVYYDDSIVPIKNSKPKNSIKIQLVNQDLNEAIQQMKVSLKKKNNSSTISQNISQRNQNNPETIHNQRLYFTETYRVKYEKKLQQIQDKKKILNSNILEKQMKARLQKKIKENRQLKGKMEILKDIQERKQELQTEQWNRRKKIIQQRKLMHQSSQAKIEMMRQSKRRASLKDLKQSRIIDKQSRKEHMFKTYIDEKQKQDRHMLLRTKLQFSLKKSDKRVRKIKTSASHRQFTSFKEVQSSRPIYTSQNIRRKAQLNLNREKDQELIIQKYTTNKQEDGEQMDQVSNFSQKKYNQNVRSPKQSDMHKFDVNDKENQKNQNHQQCVQLKQSERLKINPNESMEFKQKENQIKDMKINVKEPIKQQKQHQQSNQQNHQQEQQKNMQLQQHDKHNNEEYDQKDQNNKEVQDKGIKNQKLISQQNQQLRNIKISQVDQISIN